MVSTLLNHLEILNFLTRAPHFHLALGLTNYAAVLCKANHFLPLVRLHSVSITVFQGQPSKPTDSVNINQTDNYAAEYIT